ncbi:MAG: RbsD/FucU family protein [Verrucomicrobiota bacterium]
MLQTPILHPGLLDLLARIRHTNTLVIADAAFPYWPEIETVDLALTRGIPTVLDVLDLLTPVFSIGRIWQAEEFLETNGPDVVERFAKSFGTIAVTREPHDAFKTRVPRAIGLVRTGDTVKYGNLILESV